MKMYDEMPSSLHTISCVRISQVELFWFHLFYIVTATSHYRYLTFIISCLLAMSIEVQFHALHRKKSKYAYNLTMSFINLREKDFKSARKDKASCFQLPRRFLAARMPDERTFSAAISIYIISK